MKLQSPFRGRIGRKNYNIGLLILCIFGFFLMDLDSGVVFLGLFWMLLSFSLHVRRVHDLGYSDWYALLLFVPLANIAVIINNIFIKGDEGVNKFGEEPINKKFIKDIFNLK